MTPLRLATFAVICAATLVVPRTARSQEGRGAAGQKKLAVAVLDRGGPARPFAVSEKAVDEGHAAEISPPRQIAGWERPGGEPPLTRIRLRLTREGDAVRIDVAAVLDDSYPADAPGPKYGPREARVASYLAREGETVNVRELGRYGFEPLVLAVLEARPEPEMPVVPAPARAASRLKSVEVVSFWAEGAQMERGRVVLRNVSQKNITGLEVSVDEGVTQTAYTSGARPLLAPGGTYETEITLGRAGVEAPGGFEPMPRPDALVVSTAVFEDGSYEGDVKTAAAMVARQKGRSIQLSRILKLLQSALDADGLHAGDAFARLRAQVSGLRIDVEPSVLDALVSEFPELPAGDGRRLIAEAAMNGLRAARGEALHMLEEVESARSQKAEGFDLRRRLEDVRARIEKRTGAGRE